MPGVGTKRGRGLLVAVVLAVSLGIYSLGYVACRVSGLMVRHENCMAEKLGHSTAIFCDRYGLRDLSIIGGVELVYYPLRAMETVLRNGGMP